MFPVRLRHLINITSYNKKRLVLITTDLCLNLNGLSLSYNEIIGPHLTRLILVSSGRVNCGFKGKGLSEDDLSMATLKHREKGKIILIISPDIRKG